MKLSEQTLINHFHSYRIYTPSLSPPLAGTYITSPSWGYNGTCSWGGAPATTTHITWSRGAHPATPAPAPYTGSWRGHPTLVFTLHLRGTVSTTCSWIGSWTGSWGTHYILETTHCSWGGHPTTPWHWPWYWGGTPAPLFLTLGESLLHLMDTSYAGKV